MAARIDGATINERFLSRIAATPNAPAFWSKKDGSWRQTSWSGFGAAAASFGIGLLESGHRAGETVAVLGDTREEWAVCDIGALGIGSVVVGVYPTLTPEQAEYVVDHSDATTLVLQGQTQYDKMAAAPGGLAKVARIVTWEPVAADDPRLVSYADILALGEKALADAPTRWQDAARAVKPEDSAIIIYTSGTTGPPKGAVITHANVVFMMKTFSDAITLDTSEISFAFLPMAHVAERVVGHYSRIEGGYGAYYARSIATVLEDVGEAKPTLFGSVPRVFEKAYAKVQGELQAAPGAKKAIGQWAIDTAVEASRARRAGRPMSLVTRLTLPIADKLVMSKVRHAFGGRVQLFVSGAAPIALEILEFFDAAGLPTYEVYGMTESTGIITANRPGETKLGSVGRVIPGIEMRLAEDGEILARGPNVFAGYYKDEAATAEAVDAAGWLHTGDIGELDADGYLRITDRKKNIIVTAGGKNVAPANIENELKSDPVIGQVLVHGDRRKFLSALIALDPDESAGLAAELGLPAGDVAALAAHPAVRERVGKHVEAVNARLAQYETIKRWEIVPEDFTVDNGMLTPTMKVRRKQVEERFAGVLEGFYG